VAVAPGAPGAPGAAAARITWREATVAELVDETRSARTLVLDVPDWPGHDAGQHLDVRLTAEDGYVAERSYSIASAPEDAQVALTIERIDDGEVSPYLAGEVVVGDAFEVRGPIGGHFTWRVGDGGPVLLVGGGSGLVPLMAMLRHRARSRSSVDARLLVSARHLEDLLYRDELDALASADPSLSITYTLTRGAPAGWAGYRRRVDTDMLKTVGPEAHAMPRAFICGPTPFVEAVADALVSLGHGASAIHTERFGPTGS
jgi:ferredoxin-NADP reductase